MALNWSRFEVGPLIYVVQSKLSGIRRNLSLLPCTPGITLLLGVLWLLFVLQEESCKVHVYIAVTSMSYHEGCICRGRLQSQHISPLVEDLSPTIRKMSVIQIYMHTLHFIYTVEPKIHVLCIILYFLEYKSPLMYKFHTHAGTCVHALNDCTVLFHAF